MSDFELVSGRPGDGKPRGKLVVRTGQWSLEDQVNLAKRIQRKHWRDDPTEEDRPEERLPAIVLSRL